VQTTTTAIWTPSFAPLPSSLLPDRLSAQTAILYSVSCSSKLSCVAVGTVGDSSYNYFPLIETYSGGSWTASVAPIPSNGPVSDHAGPEDELFSVSCPANGVCAAVGTYLVWQTSQHNATIEAPFLENLSHGRWTPTEGTEPPGQQPSDGWIDYMYSVSCANTNTCMAIGAQDGGNNQQPPLVYIYESGKWQLRPEPPVPSNFYEDMELSSVSCPDATDCVVAGSYDTSEGVDGVLLTWSAGSWTVQEAPVPPNGNPSPPNVTLARALTSVACSNASECVAGGDYVDTSGNADSLLLMLQSGKWSAAEAPLPADSQADTPASITGVSCPALGACVADGNYWVNFSTGNEGGVLLTQSSSGWSAIPARVSVAAAPRLRNAKHHSIAEANLLGISCSQTSFCMAVGTSPPLGDDGNQALIEKMTKR